MHKVEITIRSRLIKLDQPMQVGNPAIRDDVLKERPLNESYVQNLKGQGDQISL
jgi:hypothetical protein